MQASVCAPVTIRRPTLRSARTASRSVASKESPYCLWISGSDSSRVSSGTYCQPWLSCGKLSSECCTQMTGAPSALALPTRVAMLAITPSRLCALARTSFWTSMTSSAVCGRSDRDVMKFSSAIGSGYAPTLGPRADTAQRSGCGDQQAPPAHQMASAHGAGHLSLASWRHGFAPCLDRSFPPRSTAYASSAGSPSRYPARPSGSEEGHVPIADGERDVISSTCRADVSGCSPTRPTRPASSRYPPRDPCRPHCQGLEHTSPGAWQQFGATASREPLGIVTVMKLTWRVPIAELAPTIRPGRLTTIAAT